jgi:hemoglobin
MIVESLYEHAGGWDMLRAFIDIFYRSCIADPLLQPLLGTFKPEHVEVFTVLEAETFGGPDRFSREMGGFNHLIDVYRGFKISEPQRQWFVGLYMAAAERAGLPDDAPFREALARMS